MGAEPGPGGQQRELDAHGAEPFQTVEGLSVGVGAATKSDALGALTFLALSYGNQPDLRSWLSLPAQFELARFRLPSGTYRVALTTGATRTVELKPRRVTLLVLRSY